MAYPKKDEKDKAVKQNFSMTPQLLERILNYCQAEERSMSYVAQKAIDKWLAERGF